MGRKLEKIKEKYPSNGPLPEYPLAKENDLLEAVSKGDAAMARHILNEILSILLYCYPEDFKIIQFRALELAVLLSRSENTALSASNSFSFTVQQFFKPLEEADNTEELIDILHLMTQHLAEQAFSFQGIPHLSALKRAERYIQNNFSRKLSLKEIAAISGLSPPYFSTIFKKEMGENLSAYVNHLRVEKASNLLAETNMPLGKISLACGFEDQSWFSKIFKHYTGTNPAKYRQKKKNSMPEIPKSDLSEDYQALINQNQEQEEE
jgi:AraC-like DNA-binding protein